jgi:biotin carboxylase
VLKPLALSGSRGVIRVNDAGEFTRAAARIGLVVRHEPGEEERRFLLAEEFIPGHEIAVEGMLTAGELEILAVFDKPDPLDGPYFEETYYVTPSRLGVRVQKQVRVTVAAACRAYGLREGPVHAELRVNDRGAWIIEVAARTIGGMCGRLLRFGTGMGLEELVLRQALGLPVRKTSEAGGAGVMMIPIPQAGILRRVEGLLAAREIPFIEEVRIDVREGYELIPLPEGDSYLGFIFAHAPTPRQAEDALRQAHACLRVVVAPVWKIESAA